MSLQNKNMKKIIYKSRMILLYYYFTLFLITPITFIELYVLCIEYYDILL